MAASSSARATRKRETRAAGSLVAGRFQVEAVLGVGGMGGVYRVVERSTKKVLALKLYGGPSAEHGSTRHRLRFRREFHTMAGLVHPRIVQVFEYGLDGDVPYYTMELLDGQDLSELGPQDTAPACALLRDVASALAFLHARRLVHRDVAPRNVRRTADGRAKLIDFGVLATAGLAGDIAGTPPLISPENVRGLPVDHRADLFGLGGLAYYLLAGRHAFPARGLEDLEELWRARPPPPSVYAPGVPPALDELVMSMLSLDPLGRPGTAAEVIDRLGAVAGLPPAPEVEVARGYLASASLVGRGHEMHLLRRRVQKAAAGDGAAVMLEAPSGRGKSRLLRELALEAQIAGATVLNVDSEAAGRGPYGLFGALARALLLAAPVEAAAAARPRASVLVRLLPDLRERLPGPIAVAPPAGGAEEERMRGQAELAGWFLEVAAKRTLALLVDDVQRSDEASAAVLATLAHAANGKRLLVATTLRTDEPIRAATAVTTLRDLSQRVRVRALKAPDVEELMRGIFGDVPHLTQLATWMQKASGGSPLHCIEIAKNLVDQGIVRYADGFWSVPDAPRLQGMPKKLADAMEARIRALRTAPRALAEALSVHGGELPLPLIVLLSETGSEEEVFAALDELLYEEVLVGSGESYRFRHDGLREALLRGLPPARRASLHLRVGKALAGDGVTAEREAEVGWHLLHGGDRTRGAELLARAGVRLYEAQSFNDAVPPLEAALEVFEAERRPPRVTLELRHMLVMAGCFSDRAVALRYADDTIAALTRYSGMSLTLRLPRVVPRLVAIAAGVLRAGLGWLFTRPSRRGPSPVAALQTLYIEVAYAAVVRAWSFHVDELRALIRCVEPLAAFKGRIPEAAYRFSLAVLGMALGYFADVRASCLRILEIAERDKVTPLPESDRKNAVGGAHSMIGTICVMNQDPRTPDAIAELEAMGLRYFDVDAHLYRMSRYRFRGEEDEAIKMEASMDVLLVQAGSMWGPESRVAWFSSFAYGVTRDVLGLRRSIERMGRYVAQGYRLEAQRDLARGEYHRERGELELSRAALEQALAAAPPEDAFVRPTALAALSETLLAQGETSAALEKAEAAIAVATRPEVDGLAWRLRGMRARALALAVGGETAAAVQELETALDLAAPLGSPSLSGGLHEARARVALATGDLTAYATHRLATDSWFRPTGNPALIARIERLPPADEVRLPSPRAAGGAVTTLVDASMLPSRTTVIDGAVTVASHADSSRWVSVLLHGCRGPSERAGRALELLVEGARARAGYLYLLRAEALELAAPIFGEEPPDELGMMLREALSAPGEGGNAERLAVVWQPDAVPGKVAWLRALLVVRTGSASRAVGAVALVGEPSLLRPPPQSLVDQIARELSEAGDVTDASSASSGGGSSD